MGLHFFNLKKTKIIPALCMTANFPGYTSSTCLALGLGTVCWEHSNTLLLINMVSIMGRSWSQGKGSKVNSKEKQ